MTEITYRAEIAPSRATPDVLEYTITRITAPTPRHPHLIEGAFTVEQVATLTTPVCAEVQACAVVYHWLLLTGVVDDVGLVDVVWHVEPIAALAQVPVRVSRRSARAARRWWRLRSALA